ncbi:hypothetical protein GGR58DRAFT_517574 [Xylaria digitata]|nr:hypothetical protein GGR58DRAFT_517574 [Xylaria digitata]
MPVNGDITTTQEYPTQEKPRVMKNTALAIRASLRSSTPPPTTIPTPAENPKSFRDIFCHSLEPQPVAVPSAPIPITAPVRHNQPFITSTHSFTTRDAEKEPARRPRVLGKFDPTRLNVDREEFEQDVVEYGLKTLKHSRWAEDDMSIPLSSNTRKIRYRRNRRGYVPKTHENAHRTEDNVDLPRVHFDVEEFKRDVAKYGLKTLKDSRWAESEQ